MGRWREGSHVRGVVTKSSTCTKREKKIFSMVVDSYFPRSKSAKCMEIVSNPTIMDVSHTTGSYGSSSVLLAVIALLLWRALSAAEIGKAHSMQALTEIHNHVCIQKRSEEKRANNYQRLKSMIYDCPFQVEMGNTIKHRIYCIQRERWKALA